MYNSVCSLSISLAWIATQFDCISFRFSDWLARCGACRFQVATTYLSRFLYPDLDFLMRPGIVALPAASSTEHLLALSEVSHFGSTDMGHPGEGPWTFQRLSEPFLSAE